MADGASVPDPVPASGAAQRAEPDRFCSVRCSKLRWLSLVRQGLRCPAGCPWRPLDQRCPAERGCKPQRCYQMPHGHVHKKRQVKVTFRTYFVEPGTAKVLPLQHAMLNCDPDTLRFLCRVSDVRGCSACGTSRVRAVTFQGLGATRGWWPPYWTAQPQSSLWQKCLVCSYFKYKIILT